jgi:hypothetical protein
MCRCGDVPMCPDSYRDADVRMCECADVRMPARPKGAGADVINVPMRRHCERHYERHCERGEAIPSIRRVSHRRCADMSR